MKRLRFLLVLAVFVVVLAVQAIPTQAFSASAYQKIYEGIWYATGTATSPRLMKAFALKVDTQNPNVHTKVSSGNGTLPYEVTLQGTDAFLSYSGSKVAINTTFWNAAQSPYVDVYGLVISGGGVVSDGQTPFSGQLRFTSAMVPSLVSSTTTPTGFWDAVGGGELILQNGVITTSDPTINPYTCVGISQDGRYVIMVCIDGRQSGWSDGCNFPEMAQWLLDFGAWNGMQLDGGGSTCMVREDIGVCNRPCYGYVRAVAVSLGFSSIAATPDSGPVSVSWDANQIDVFATGGGNIIHRKTWTSGGGWGGWTELTGVTSNMSPGVCSWGNGRIDMVYVSNTDNQLYWKYFSGGVWSSATSIGSAGVSIYAPTICTRGSGLLDVFIVSTDHKIYQKTYSNGSWSGTWAQPLGSSWLTNNPVACSSWGTNRIDLHPIGQGGNIYHYYWNGSSWTYDGYLSGFYTDTAVGACSWGTNRLDIAVNGLSHTIYHYYKTTGSWSYNWLDTMGGVTTVGPASMSKRGTNALDCFYRGSNDHLYQRSYNSGWGSWVDLGNYFD